MSALLTRGLLIAAVAHLCLARSDVDAALISYQQGVSGYAGTQDSDLVRLSPTANFSADIDLELAGSGSFIRNSLIRFDDVFGNGSGQIPLGTAIASATLILENIAPNPAPSLSLHRVLVDWDEATVTWNNFGSTPGGASGIDYSAVSTNTLTTGVLGPQSVDVSADVQLWANGASNFGWYILGQGAAINGYASSEHGTLEFRPELVIEFVPEPSSMALCAIAAMTMAAGYRRGRRKRFG